jgi:SPP1 gp7 family putative phage head morphogenesis protein
MIDRLASPKVLPEDDGYTNKRVAFEQREPFGKGGSDFTFKSMGGGLGAAWVMALGGDRSMTKPYAQNPWVYACIEKISESVASLPMRVQKPRVIDGHTKWVDVTSGKLFDLLKKPNPLMSSRKFLKLVTMYHLLHGESYLMLQDANSQPIATEGGFGASIPTPTYIFPAAGDRVQEKCGSKVSNLPSSYRIYSGSGSHVDYVAAAVAPITSANPYSHLRGLGPTTAAMREAGKMFQADRYDEALLKNGGRPGGFLTTEGDLGEEEAKAVLNSFRQANESPDKHGKTALLPFGTTYKESGFSPKDMEFKELRETVRQTIMSVYGVTKTILGITDDVNRANAREAYRVFWEVSILPFAEFFQDELQHHLISRLQGEEKNYRVVLDTSGVSVLREDLDSKVKRTLDLVKDGKLSLRAAARAAEFHELADGDYDGLDERWVTSNQLPHELAADVSTGRGKDGVADRSVDSAAPLKVEEVPIVVAEDDDDDEEARHARRVAAAWKANEDFKREREKKMVKKVKRVQEEFILAVRKKLRAKAKKSTAGLRVIKYVASEAEIERLLAMNMDEWTKAMGSAAIPEVEATLLAAAATLHAEVAGSGTILTLTDPAVVQFMAAKNVALAEGTMSSLAEAVHLKIVKVLAGAEEATSIGTAISEVLVKMESEMTIMLNSVGARAERIAVTEVGSATSFARTEQMKKDEIEKHEWGTQQDGTVRDSHRSLHGMVREIGKEFGFGLHHPHDMAHGAGPGQFVNCHCFTLPVL